MNKREKAIWNIIMFVSIILLIIFIEYIATGLLLAKSDYNKLTESTSLFKKDLLSSEETDLNTNDEVDNLFKKYDLLQMESLNNDMTNKRTQSQLNNFMEHKKHHEKSEGKKSFSSIEGFSLYNKKISPKESFIDLNGNKIWDENESFTDLNNNGIWNDGKYLLTEIPGELFISKKDTSNKCQNKANIFLKNVYFLNDGDTLKFQDLSTIEETLSFDTINYFHTQFNENLEIYINTHNEIDEYYFETACFKCSIAGSLEEKLNELEIELSRQKEGNFNLPSELNDPTDLSNVIILEGQDGYNQNKKFRTLIPTAIIQNENTGKKQVSILYQGIRSYLEEGDEIAKGKIVEIRKSYCLFEKNGKIDTLKMSD